jgi:uncharacterized cupredoxin-like copper-binding protein
MTFLRSITALTAVALAVGGTTAALASTSSTKVTTVKVTMKDFSFVLSPKTARHGTIRFTIRNAGHTNHDFAIARKKSKSIGPGKSTTLTVTLKKGRYPYKCTIDSHAKLGMKGVLRVT